MAIKREFIRYDVVFYSEKYHYTNVSMEFETQSFLTLKEAFNFVKACEKSEEIKYMFGSMIISPAIYKRHHFYNKWVYSKFVYVVSKNGFYKKSNRNMYYFDNNNKPKNPKLFSNFITNCTVKDISRKEYLNKITIIQ